MESVKIGEHPLWNFGGMNFHSDTLIAAWVVSIFLITLAVVIRIGIKLKPGRLQSAAEIGLESVGVMLKEKLGEEGMRYFPLIATLFFFILCSNWLGILPLEMKPPTADINTTAALAMLTIILVQIFGIMKKGLLGYLHKFIEPHPVFLPLNFMEELAKPVSLAVRLFGNVFSKETIIIILTGLMAFPLIYPIPILALGLLVGGIQAYVFALLAVFYISMAVEGH
jgi:F-type H+-transporting ATPase subunit a